MKTMNGQDLKKLFLSGANNLYNHYPEVDQLNVFPVPDGDTGMNMNLTMTSGSKQIQNKNEENIYEISKSFSMGLLMGARGNSGVITSQIFRGFSEAILGKEEIDVHDFAAAWEKGREVAYKAVKVPVEGTILTVIREASAALTAHLAKKKDLSIEDALDYLFQASKTSLQHTPELLPILKEVGVVDSGGAGLCVIFEGMVKAAHDEFVERNDINDSVKDTPVSSFLGSGKEYAGAKLTEDEEGYGYCTQFILRLGSPEEGKRPFVEKKFETFLNTHGKSVVLVHDDDIVKVHVHTLAPGAMLNYAQNYGEFVTITIENMSEEHDNISHGAVATDMESNLARNKKPKEKEWVDHAVVAVSSGKGLNEIFKELGTTYIVTGGQTMNPSAEDFIKAIDEVHAHNVYLLPNNSNIVMTAAQAAEIADGENVKVYVIPTKTIPQGIAALTQFSPEQSAEDNFEMMNDIIGAVKSGSVTFAIKDTDIDGVHITKDHYMAMAGGHDIVACVPDKQEALRLVLENLVDEETSMITVFYGEDVGEEEGNVIAAKVAERYPDIDIDVRKGDQPVYSFLIGIE